jgi:hypothetical protein
VLDPQDLLVHAFSLARFFLVALFYKVTNLIMGHLKIPVSASDEAIY